MGCTLVPVGPQAKGWGGGGKQEPSEDTRKGKGTFTPQDKGNSASGPCSLLHLSVCLGVLKSELSCSFFSSPGIFLPSGSSEQNRFHRKSFK